MQWLIQAHEELVDIPVPKLSVKYSGKFKGFNANVRYGRSWMEFSLSRDWEQVDTDIQKGVVQHLMQKIYKTKKSTMHIDMYEEFLRQASNYAPKGESDDYLTERFKVLNREYFEGFMEQPTLTWGQFSTTKLGSYHYATDTVTISTALKDNQDMLDYVLYHELLHKKHKFTCSGGRTHHHTKEFKAEEALFRVPNAEVKLNRFIAQKRREKRARAKPKKKPRSILSWFQ